MPKNILCSTAFPQDQTKPSELLKDGLSLVGTYLHNGDHSRTMVVLSTGVVGWPDIAVVLLEVGRPHPTPIRTGLATLEAIGYHVINKPTKKEEHGT